MVLILYQTFNFFPHLLKDRYVLNVSPKTHSLETLSLMCKYWVGPNKVCLFRSWGPHLTEGLTPTIKQLCVSSLLAFCLIIMQQEGPHQMWHSNLDLAILEPEEMWHWVFTETMKAGREPERGSASSTSWRCRSCPYSRRMETLKKPIHGPDAAQEDSNKLPLGES